MNNCEKRAQKGGKYTCKRVCSLSPNNNQDLSAQAFVINAGKRARLPERGERMGEKQAELEKETNDKHVLHFLCLQLRQLPIGCQRIGTLTASNHCPVATTLSNAPHHLSLSHLSKDWM